MAIKHFLLLLVLAIIISACSQSDMQGIDPNEYYTEHPVKNTVETRHALHTLTFDTKSGRITDETARAFQAMMQDVSPYAVESITVRVAPSQMENGAWRQRIAKLLQSMDYSTMAIHFEAAKETSLRDAELDIVYAAIVAPRCPDWRVSPTTSNSNTYRENFGCATTVNLGAQLADPRDLESGKGQPSIDTESAVQALKTYRSGEGDGQDNNSESTTNITPSSGGQ